MIAPSYTCPNCHRTSYNEDDVQHQYCGHCHASSETVRVRLRVENLRKSAITVTVECVIYMILIWAGVLLIDAELAQLPLWERIVVSMAMGLLVSRFVWGRQ